MCNGKAKDDDVFKMREGYDAFGRLNTALVGYAGLPIIDDFPSGQHNT
jgi:hypothetical protein